MDASTSRETEGISDQTGQRFVRISEDVVIDTQTGDQLMPTREVSEQDGASI